MVAGLGCPVRFYDLLIDWSAIFDLDPNLTANGGPTDVRLVCGLINGGTPQARRCTGVSVCGEEHADHRAVLLGPRGRFHEMRDAKA